MLANLVYSELAKRLAPSSASMSARHPDNSDGESPDKRLAETALAVQTSLRRSPGLADAKIWCEVDGGAIVLCGRVPTYSAKHAARTLAEKVSGGCRVENRLGVVPYPVE